MQANHRPTNKQTLCFRVLILLLMAFSLSACGFVTAPLSLSGAQIARSSVRVTDYSVTSGRKAAVYTRDLVQETSIRGYRASTEYANNLLQYLFFEATAAPVANRADQAQITGQ